MKKNVVKMFLVASLVFGMQLPGKVFAQGQHSQNRFVASWTQRTVAEIRQSLDLFKTSNNAYVIQWGDTLHVIAEALGMTVDQLVQMNQIANPDLIIAGAELTYNPVTHQLIYDTGEEVYQETIQETTEEVVVSEESTVTTIVPEVTTSSVVETTTETSQEVSQEDFEETTLETTQETSQTEWEETTQEILYETTAEIEPLPAVEQTEWSEEIITSIEEQVSSQELTATTMETQNWENSSSDPRIAFDRITAEKSVSAQEKELWAALINRESAWNIYAQNSYSGAYGLPQALPGNKMASHGADWATNPYTQLAWMYDYMVNRYGSISAAWSHSQNVGWY